MRYTFAVALAVTLAACGSSPSTPSSTSQNPPSPTANRPPTITSAQVAPTWGISTLTTHAFTTAANDPDGDALTYSWDYGNGTTSASSGGSVIYDNAVTFTYQAKLTVTDSKGLSATSTVPVTSVTIGGNWAGTLMGYPITLKLTQYLGGFVSGTWDSPELSAHGDVGPTGELGKIQANGQFELRMKVRVGSYTDFYYRGTIDPSGQRLTGTLQDSGFTGQYMQLDKR